MKFKSKHSLLATIVLAAFSSNLMGGENSQLPKKESNTQKQQIESLGLIYPEFEIIKKEAPAVARKIFKSGVNVNNFDNLFKYLKQETKEKIERATTIDIYIFKSEESQSYFIGVVQAYVDELYKKTVSGISEGFNFDSSDYKNKQELKDENSKKVKELIRLNHGKIVKELAKNKIESSELDWKDIVKACKSLNIMLPLNDHLVPAQQEYILDEIKTELSLLNPSSVVQKGAKIKYSSQDTASYKNWVYLNHDKIVQELIKQGVTPESFQPKDIITACKSLNINLPLKTRVYNKSTHKISIKDMNEKHYKKLTEDIYLYFIKAINTTNKTSVMPDKSKGKTSSDMSNNQTVAQALKIASEALKYSKYSSNSSNSRKASKEMRTR